ncbi:MAG: 4Fe-4S dicluster domain-containing protein [Bacteroidales bacterium]|nr:4Fe-4S dicluster domain-containing protein [Bacteroidales bacterium]
MSINRRNFFKVLGVTGVTLATGKSLNAAQITESKTEFNGMLYDSTRCVGCQGCEFACAEAHGLPAPSFDDTPVVGVERKSNETRRTVVNAYTTTKGDFYVKRQCMHCNDPACAAACLTKAMYKTKEGSVIWRGDKCMGCRYCMVSCPFDGPKFEYFSANPKIEKCDMCYDRFTEGEIPACAQDCPMEAIVFGTRRDLMKEARKRIRESPDLYYDHIYGEHEAGGTGWLYLSPVPFEELNFKTTLQNSSYPALTKGFLYAVPSIFVLWPAILLGIHQATKANNSNEEENE